MLAGGVIHHKDFISSVVNETSLVRSNYLTFFVGFQKILREKKEVATVFEHDILNTLKEAIKTNFND